MLSFAAASIRPAAAPTQGNWTRLGSYTPPYIRESAAAAYDSQRNETILFGGQTPSLVNGTGLNGDTWAFDGQRWIQKQPVHSPSPRARASAAYDPAEGYILLFGGDASGFNNETWIWNGSDWIQLFPAHSPPARMIAAMAYDPASKTLVLFGGMASDAFTPLNDTWTWDGNDWTQQLPLLSPSPRWEVGFADGGGGLPPTLFGGSSEPNDVTLNDTWTWNSAIPTWIPVASATSPPPRFGHKFVYDPSLGVDVMFGGVNNGLPGMCGGNVATPSYFNDTWTWNGSQWTQVTPANSPLCHIRFGMVFDSARSRIQMFGGTFQGCASSGTVAGWANDTWGFDGTTWAHEDINAPDELRYVMLAREPVAGTALLFGGRTEYYNYSQETWRWEDHRWQLLAPQHVPLPREAAALVFDPATNTTVLFGGFVDTFGYPGTGEYYTANDTWTWDGTDWTQQQPATSPPARFLASAVYDAGREQVVLFGGAIDGNYNTPGDDTWTWDGSNWTQQNPVNSPPARVGASMAYDPSTQTVVLFGGFQSTNQVTYDDTWIWDGTNWTQVFPASSPPAKAYPGMGYDPDSSSVILFGGCDNCFANPTWTDETWRWDGSNWTQLFPDEAPFPRMSFAMISGDANGPLLLFGGERPGINPDGTIAHYDSGTAFLNDIWAFGAVPPATVTKIVSRKTHGSAGTFDVDLTNGNGVECRSGGANGDYTLVFSFANTLTSAGNATVTSGTGTVASNNIDSSDPYNYIVNLTGVANAQAITVNLNNVTDSAGDFSSAVAGSMRILIGDTNVDSVVNSADIGQTKSQSGQAVTTSNFREDLNADGAINSADIGLVKSKSGTALP